MNSLFDIRIFILVTLSLLAARGTYTFMYVDAWNLVGGKLVKT